MRRGSVHEGPDTPDSNEVSTERVICYRQRLDLADALR
jgi:hypothetical protein